MVIDQDYKISYNPKREEVKWQDLVDLFLSVEWGKRDRTEIADAFMRSSHRLFIYKDNKLVGVGRTLDDAKYYAMIVDVAIEPAHQGKGLGSYIVNELKDRLEGYLFITLTAAPGKGSFYEKLNWKRQSSAFIWPINQRQIDEHSS